MEIHFDFNHNCFGIRERFGLINASILQMFAINRLRQKSEKKFDWKSFLSF